MKFNYNPHHRFIWTKILLVASIVSIFGVFGSQVEPEVEYDEHDVAPDAERDLRQAPVVTTTPNPRKPPTRQQLYDSIRQVPICIESDPLKMDDTSYLRFTKVFEHLDIQEKTVGADFILPVFPNDQIEPLTRYVESMELTRINVHDRDFFDLKPNQNPPTVKEIMDFNDHHLSFLKNWVHITFKFKFEVEGLFLQNIAAPLGVPKGQFRTDFKCGDCGMNHDPELVKEMIPIPCKCRPVSSIRHPYAMTIGGRRNATTKFSEAHFHMNWIEHIHDEMSYFQFMIIVVKDFEYPLYEVFFTQVMDNHDLDVNSGVLSPFYRGWDEKLIQCHNDSYQYDPEKVNSDTGRIKFVPYINKEVGAEGRITFNMEYDYYLRNGPPKGIIEPFCPPPLFVDEGDPGRGAQPYIAKFTDVTAWKDDRQEYPTKFPLCRRCGTVVVNHDPCTEKSGKPPPAFCAEIVRNESAAPHWQETQLGDHSTHYITRTILKFHGTFMIFAWGAPMAISFYYGRFTKEAHTMAKQHLVMGGLGTWLVSHMYYTYLSLTGGLCGIFLLIPFGKDFCIFYEYSFENSEQRKLEKCNGWVHYHITLGVFTLVCFCISYITAWIRPHTPYFRAFFILVHVGCGYVGKYVALLSIVFTNVSLIPAIIWIVAEVISVGLFIGATVVQCLSDKKSGLYPPRKWYPVLEAIEAYAEVPLKLVKQILLLVQIISQWVLFFILAFLYHLLKQVQHS